MLNRCHKCGQVDDEYFENEVVGAMERSVEVLKVQNKLDLSADRKWRAEERMVRFLDYLRVGDYAKGESFEG